MVCCCDFRGVAERPTHKAAPTSTRYEDPRNFRLQAVFRGFSYALGRVDRPRRRRRVLGVLVASGREKRTPTAADVPVSSSLINPGPVPPEIALNPA